VAVAVEEALQPQHVRIPPAPDDHRARAGLDQAHAAEDQGAHDPLAELRLGDEHGPQPLGREGKRLDGGPGDGVHQGRQPRELGQLAHERARPVGHDRHRPAHPVVLGDVDLALEDDEHPHAGLAHPRQGLARPVGADLAEAAQPRDLGRLQGREHLVPAAVDGRGGLDGHGGSGG
jgi:hypothetical protein